MSFCFVNPRAFHSGEIGFFFVWNWKWKLSVQSSPRSNLCLQTFKGNEHQIVYGPVCASAQITKTGCGSCEQKVQQTAFSKSKIPTSPATNELTDDESSFRIGETIDNFPLRADAGTSILPESKVLAIQNNLLNVWRSLASIQWMHCREP